MLSVEQAATFILDSLSPLSAIKKPLDDCPGYYLSGEIAAERDYPPFDRITHDGIAINFSAYKHGRREFSIEGYAAAGSPQAVLSHPENAIEVATGAPLPKGCDTVIPYEVFSLDGKQAVLQPNVLVKTGDSLHLKASDLKKGQIVLKISRCIGIPEMAILAANGVAEVPVHAKPSIGILATGDELVEVESSIEPHQIRRSNDRTLKAALRLNGFDDVETDSVPDDKAAIEAKLALWLAQKDVVLITGGVSKGARDYVPEVLMALGTKQIFHHVAQRPGKPLWFGKKQASLAFGLPGNPNSALVCLIRYVLPALHSLSGGSSRTMPRRILGSATPSHDTLTLFTPVKIRNDGAAVPMTTRTSGDFTGLLGSDGFVELPPRANEYAAGEQVSFYPWSQQ